MPTLTAGRVLVVAMVTAAIGNGLVAGVFFAFSSFVMPALARVAPLIGVQAMQSINITVIRSAFLAAYLLTTILSAILVVAPWWFSSGLASRLAAVAGVIAVVGSFGVTMRLNVPLNNSLATAIPDGAATAVLWATYVRDWGVANVYRALASCSASVLFTLAAVLKAGNA